jgi:hypothetical protein
MSRRRHRGGQYAPPGWLAQLAELATRPLTDEELDMVEAGVWPDCGRAARGVECSSDLAIRDQRKSRLRVLCRSF